MSGGESKSAAVTSCLDANASVHLFVELVRGFAGQHRLVDTDGARLAIIVEELVFNLFDHGGVTEGDMIELALTLTDAGVVLALADPGQAYDPRGHRSTQAIPDRGGGAGLALVAAWTMVIDYRSGDGRNRLDLLLPLQD
jgi:serine/threonine-protein kinase RsbW